MDNIYKIITGSEQEDRIMQSDHYVKFVVNPERKNHELYCVTGDEVTVADLMNAVNSIIVGTYNGLLSLEDTEEEACFFKEMIKNVVQDEDFWKGIETN